MKKQETPTREMWTLDKIKIKAVRDSVDFKSTFPHVIGQDTYQLPKDGLYPIPPHPDLVNQLEALKYRLAHYFGYTLVKTLITDKKFGADKAQIQLVENLVEVYLENIEVTGVSFTGKERLAVCISGTYNGNSINTKPLYFSNEEYGESLEAICNGICDEAYLYVFEGKKAQLEMAFNEDEEDDLMSALNVE